MSILESDRVRELLQRAGLETVDPRVLKGAVAAAVLVCALGVWRFWPSAPAPEVAFTESVEVAGAAGEAPGAEAGAASEEPSATAGIVVHVAGAVMRPGVYELPLGSRVTDAVEAAGGLLGTAASEAVNLARILADGEQVFLPTHAEVESGSFAAGGGGSTGGGSATGGVGGGGSGLVNLNTASVTELDALPGIGPATAQKIVDDRAANGPFGKPEDLMRVPGIGESKYSALKDLVTTR